MTGSSSHHYLWLCYYRDSTGSFPHTPNKILQKPSGKPIISDIQHRKGMVFHQKMVMTVQMVGITQSDCKRWEAPKSKWWEAPRASANGGNKHPEQKAIFIMQLEQVVGSTHSDWTFVWGMGKRPGILTAGNNTAANDGIFILSIDNGVNSTDASPSRQSYNYYRVSRDWIRAPRRTEFHPIVK